MGIKTFKQFRDEQYNSFSFMDKVYYHWIGIWTRVSIYFQLITHKLFGVDWSERDE